MTNEQMNKNLKSPIGKIDVVLDTDAYNEIDDQYAIAYMMKSKGKLNVKAIYAAPFFNDNSTSPGDGMQKSYDEIIKLLDLMNEEDMKKNVYKGADGFLENEKKPEMSPAAMHLAGLAMNYTPQKPLYVIGIAAITDIASAILFKPEIAEKIVVVWLGGNSREYAHTAEFNMKQDIAAARVVFSSGAPIVQIPCFGVASSFSISRQELERFLKGKNPVCDYLVNNTIDAVGRNVQIDWTRIIWDATAIGWVLNEDGNLMEDKTVNIKMPLYNNMYSDECSENIMRYVYYINRDELMRNMIEALTRGESEVKK